MLQKHLSQIDKFLYKHKIAFFMHVLKYHPETLQDDIFLCVYSLYERV